MQEYLEDKNAEKFDNIQFNDELDKDWNDVPEFDVFHCIVHHQHMIEQGFEEIESNVLQMSKRKEDAPWLKALLMQVTHEDGQNTTQLGWFVPFQ